MSKTERRVNFFKAISFLIVWAHRRGISIMPICFYRSTEEQNKLYQKGRGLFPDKTKIVTNCDGHEKRSCHQDWIAMDVVIIENDKIVWVSPKYDILGNEWRRRGHIWGGDFKGLGSRDIYHYQL